MKKNICLIYNYAQHYRKDVFELLDKEFNVDFIFGNKMDDVKKMDYNLLKKVTEVDNVVLKHPFYYQKGIFNSFKKHELFLILGDLNCISTWLFLIKSKFTSKRIYLWSHGWYGKENKIKSILKKIFFKLPNGVFLYGNYSRQLMLEKGFSDKKLFVIYNSLSYDIQLSVRKKLKTSDLFEDFFNSKNPNLIFIGRLTSVKKIDLLIKALVVLKNRSFDVNLTLIGDGIMANSLKELVSKENLENVWFYGPSYDENEISKLIYNADICVSPGNVGLTAIHSLMYGTPVITHNDFKYQMPEFEAVKDGVTGSFFEMNNVNDLSLKIESWLKSNLNKREKVREDCFFEIDSKWNPHNQITIFKKNII